MAKSTRGNTGTATTWGRLEEALAKGAVHGRHGPAVPRELDGFDAAELAVLQRLATRARLSRLLPAVPVKPRDEVSEAARQARVRVAPKLSDVCDGKAPAVIVGHGLGAGWPVSDAHAATPGRASGSRPRGTARP